MIDQSNIASTIEQTYLHKLDSLPPEMRRHFLFRCFISDPTPSRLAKLSRESIRFTNEIHEKFFNTPLATLVSDFMKASTKLVPLKQHDENKFAVWKKYPNIYLLYKFLMNEFYFRYFNRGSRVTLPKDFEDNLDSLVLNPEFTLYSAAFQTCIIYLLFHFEILDVRAGYLMLFQSVFRLRPTVNHPSYTNYIYGLTHFLICASNFYLVNVDKNEHSWVIDQLIKEISSIRRDATLDIQTETALSLRMSGSQVPFINDQMQRLGKLFDFKIGFIPRTENATLKQSEHLNSLTILLCRHPWNMLSG